MQETHVRLAQPTDRDQLARLRHALWPESSSAHHAKELTQILADNPPGILPLVIFVAASNDGTLVGFLEAGLRSYADGCDPVHPVGYIEGWYVIEARRRQGLGAALLRAAEDWARTQGCIEMASDTQLENLSSQRAHEALGFEITERSILYRKAL